MEYVSSFKFVQSIRAAFVIFNSVDDCNNLYFSLRDPTTQKQECIESRVHYIVVYNSCVRTHYTWWW